MCRTIIVLCIFTNTTTALNMHSNHLPPRHHHYPPRHPSAHHHHCHHQHRITTTAVTTTAATLHAMPRSDEPFPADEDGRFPPLSLLYRQRSTSIYTDATVEADKDAGHTAGAGRDAVAASETDEPPPSLPHSTQHCRTRMSDSDSVPSAWKREVVHFSIPHRSGG